MVVVDYKGDRFLACLIESLLSQSYKNFEIVIVSNSSRDLRTSSFENGRIKILFLGENLGFAEGCNHGVKIATGDWIMLLNNDAWVQNDCLARLSDALGANESAACVVSKIQFFPIYTSFKLRSPAFTPSDVDTSSADRRKLGLRVRFPRDWKRSTGLINVAGFHGSEIEDGNEWRWSKDKATAWIPLKKSGGDLLDLEIGTPQELLGRTAIISIGSDTKEINIDGDKHHLSFGDIETFDVINSAGSLLNDEGDCRERGIYEKDEGQYDEPEEVSAFSGCSVLIRKEVFEELGGFDPKFFAYYEDADLSWRIKKAGWKILYEPKSVVRHHRSMTSGQQSPFFCFHIYRNKRWSIAKNARFAFAVKVLLKEFCTWIPQDVNRNREYSAARLKGETIFGMIRYLTNRMIPTN